MIRRLLFIGVAASAFAGAAAAADLPVAPGAAYYPAVVTPVPYFDWGGIYVGANAGAAWATQRGVAITDVPTGAVTSTSSTSSLGFGGGGQIGASLFLQRSFVLGVEGDFDGLTNKTTLLAPDGTNRHDGKLEFLSTARGRFGLTADRLLFYVTGGFAWAEDQVKRTQIAGTVNNALPGTVESVSNFRHGWTGGGGVEYGFAPNWTARVEYLFATLDKVSYTFPLAGRTTTTPIETINMLRVGVNYKFGGFFAPISARD